MTISNPLIHNKWMHDQLLELSLDDVISNALELTRHVCQSSFSQINIIGQYKHWRKAHSGLCKENFDDTVELSELALRADQFFEVVDVLEDKRLTNHEITINGRVIKYYAAIPLILSDNSIIGTISIMDCISRTLTDNEKSLFSLLAKNTSSQIDLHLKNNKLEKSIHFPGLTLESTTNSSDTKVNINHELDQFTHRVSHDLKSPLNAIKNVTSWIQEDIESGSTEDNSKNFAMVNNSVDRMHQLLADLRAYSKIGREIGIYENINLEDLVTDSVNDITNANHYKITVESCDVVKLPKISLLFVLTHLLSNAIKHHHKALGFINVRCESTLNNYQLSVTDDGPGIPIAFQNKIFDVFEKLKSKDEVEGSGLGLAMIRKTLAPYSAEINVNSQLESGTTFTIIWPKDNSENK